MNVTDESVAGIQIHYARVAGFVYLLLIALFMAGQLLISHVVGRGDFTQRLVHTTDGQALYRVGLVTELLSSLFTVLLAYALYVVLKPVHDRIARMALYWRLGEAFVGGMTAFISFTALSLQSSPSYLQSFGREQLKAIVDLAHTADFASFNISTLFFSFGSILFFYLFMQTRYIPRALSAFGVFASVVTLFASLANLVWPAHASLIQYVWIPIFVSEIATGIWLLVRGVRLDPMPASDATSIAETP